jgi:integrase
VAGTRAREGRARFTLSGLSTPGAAEYWSFVLIRFDEISDFATIPLRLPPAPCRNVHIPLQNHISGLNEYAMKARSITEAQTDPNSSAVFVTLSSSSLSYLLRIERAKISRRLASINVIHKEKGKLPLTSQRHPEISAALQAIKQTEGNGSACKEPIDSETAMLAVGSSSSSVALARNKAMFLLGLYGAFRRSELAGVLLENISWRSGGLTITIPTSEIDSVGKGREFEISSSSNPRTCPVIAVREWRRISGLDKKGSGPIFGHVDRNGRVGSSGLNPASMNYMVKKLLGIAGSNRRHIPLNPCR